MHLPSFLSGVLQLFSSSGCVKPPPPKDICETADANKSNKYRNVALDIVFKKLNMYVWKHSGTGFPPASETSGI